ncbi:MAG: HDOD domain-containing protein [Fibrobacteria bacterium]|nr:HDOD domain-containing protein [Fibrobacteria bacterium]
MRTACVVVVGITSDGEYMQLRDSIINCFDSLDSLPAFPETTRKLMAKLENPNSSAGDVAGILQYDPSISAVVLKMANSAYYNPMGKEIGNIQQAVARLGFVEVRKICMALGTMKIFVNSSGLIDLRQFWKHSIAVAMCTRIIFRLRAKHLDAQEDAFTAGLFHDIGTLILDQFFPEEYVKVRESDLQNEKPISEIEGEVLGIDHGEIGGRLLEKWKFPAFICETVKYHHEPDKCDEAFKDLCQVIHVANSLVTCSGILEPGETILEGFSNTAWFELGLDVDIIPTIIEDVKKETEGADVFASLGIG